MEIPVISKVFLGCSCWTVSIISVPVTGLVVKLNRGTFSLKLSTGGSVGFMSSTILEATEEKNSLNCKYDSHIKL